MRKAIAILFSLVLLASLGLVIATSEVSAATSGKVYWTNRDGATLSVTDLASNLTTQLVAPAGGRLGRLQDVDLDSSSGVLYFADWGPVGSPGGEGSINQVNKDGTGLAAVLSTGDAVHQLALDAANQVIYFTRAVSYDNHEISHVDYTGANYTVLLSGGFSGPGWFPSGLALDSANSLLYWGDIGVIFNPPNGSVNSMTTAGGSPTQLTPHVTGRGRGFALEPSLGLAGTIFLTSHDPAFPGANGAIHVYDIATGVETLLVGPDPDTGYWDIEIDPTAQRIWWTAPGAGEIRSAKFDGTDIQVELSGLKTPYGLALELNTAPVAACVESVNPHGGKTPPAGSTTLPGPKGGQNEDGFYKLGARDNEDPPETLQVFVSNASGSFVVGPFSAGDVVKITEARKTSVKSMGSTNGQAGAVAAHITLDSDAFVTAIDPGGLSSDPVVCLVPRPPK